MHNFKLSRPALCINLSWLAMLLENKSFSATFLVLSRTRCTSELIIYFVQAWIINCEWFGHMFYCFIVWFDTNIHIINNSFETRLQCIVTFWDYMIDYMLMREWKLYIIWVQVHSIRLFIKLIFDWHEEGPSYSYEKKYPMY